MEQNTPLIAKKIWNLMRVAFYMLRKGICKRKILLDLNLAMKRGKIAGKALQNLMFHHHNHDSSSKVGLDGQFNPQGEYEFRCNNTPLYRQYFTNHHKSKTHLSKNNSLEEDMKNIEAVNNMFDMMMMSNNEVMVMSLSSPALLGFGRSPTVRHVTDSPFPLQSGEDDDDKHVDAAADEFINKFYSQLKQQKYY